MKGTDTQTNFIVSEIPVSTGLEFDQEKIELIQRTIARGASPDELALFIEQCRRTGLDPFARQIYSVRRKQWSSHTRSFEDQQVIQVSIDGFRLIADRTRKYAGQVGPWWCGPDGEWQEVWLSDEAPSAARVGVLRHDFHQPLYATAIFKSYVQTNQYGEPISRWKTDPAGMLAKCAEALALRRAFPQELSGLYTTEEMGQADNPALNGRDGYIRPGEKVTGTRPFLPEELKANFARAVGAIEARGMSLGPNDAAVVELALESLLESGEQVSRYLQYLAGVDTLAELNEPEVIALHRLLKPMEEGGRLIPCPEAVQEAAAVIDRLDSQEVTEDFSAEENLE